MTPVKIRVQCPNCEVEAALLDVYVVANGEVIFENLCGTCHNHLTYRTNFAELICTAFESDTEIQMQQNSSDTGNSDDEKEIEMVFDEEAFLKGICMIIPGDQLLLPAPDNETTEG